jgi:hypothetical protein
MKKSLPMALAEAAILALACSRVVLGNRLVPGLVGFLAFLCLEYFFVILTFLLSFKFQTVDPVYARLGLLFAVMASF